MVNGEILGKCIVDEVFSGMARASRVGHPHPGVSWFSTSPKKLIVSEPRGVRHPRESIVVQPKDAKSHRNAYALVA